MESPSTVAKTVWDIPSYLIRDDRFKITKNVLKVQENRMAKTSPDACLRCDAGEQTLAHPRGLVDSIRYLVPNMISPFARHSLVQDYFGDW